MCQAYQEAPTTSKRRRGEPEPEFANGLDDRGRPIIPGERKSSRMAARERSASEEPIPQSASSDVAGSEIGADEPNATGRSTNGHGNGDHAEDVEPNEVAPLESRSDEIIVVD